MRMPCLIRAARRAVLVGMAAVAAGGGGCAANYRVTNAENVLSYDRPFTDASLEISRKDAAEICADRRKVAIQTSDVCTMTRCYTNFQCIAKDDVPWVVP
jgi:hypothetical protein